MADDSSAPATKQDIRMLMDEFGKMWQWKAQVEDRFDVLEERVELLNQDMKRYFAESKEHFDLIAENIREDFRSANREEIEVIKDTQKRDGNRITVLEQTMGIAA